MKQKTSDLIKEIRALKEIKGHGDRSPTGENIPGIYNAHMSAITTEDELEMARNIVRELYPLCECDRGRNLEFTRDREIQGLIALWDAEKAKEQP